MNKGMQNKLESYKEWPGGGSGSHVYSHQRMKDGLMKLFCNKYQGAL